ncbi:DUF4179 domain-containing protein [Paenisporosarcina indica]|uniref:DUF4179 domain-containing protein n=1 Tax=Paenisporosarcina indica TaxID=650093 RepID=UPI00094FE84E|nr:DUF4179 domain-containing protein [Paenisporosarcina indica]
MTESYKQWLDLDIENIEPMSLTDSRKAEIKHTVLVNSRKKKGFVQLRYLTVAAIVFVSAVTTMSYTFPTFASQIPFMQNVISYFNKEDSIYEKYGDFATEIGYTQISNGTSIMIENAVFDGTSLTVSYAIETDADLSPSTYTSNRFDIKGASGLSGSGAIRKISDTRYVGLERLTPHFDTAAPAEIEVSWQPKTFIDQTTNTEINGDWNFNFTLSKLDNEIQPVQQSVTDHGVTVVVTSLKKNEMSTVIEYESVVDEEILKQWPFVSVQFETIQDNLGNTYIVDSNGSKSNDNGVSFESSATIKAIDPNAKSLKLVPMIYFSLGSGRGLETKFTEPIIIDLK